ncbi:hypothetical protein [Ruegeria arenilitoris]|uniref:hypothetical protein n=2 Tax=Ruegeria arenilitoris TaxID=1173585 RepID=UPI00147DA98A|nr:hypothetical protein [Ruegeria arenilitoris]
MKTFLSSIAYILVVFPLALGWHVGLFKEQYESFGYFAGEPNVFIGLLTIVIQGIALASIFPLFHTGSVGMVRAFQFSSLMGIFFWTSHVLAFVAKQNVPNAGGFVLLETGYLALQFGIYAFLLSLIYRAEI